MVIRRCIPVNPDDPATMAWMTEGDRRAVLDFYAFLKREVAYDTRRNEYVPLDQVGQPGVVLAGRPGDDE